ncbi:hypothetical protein QQ045_000911 [Rhodiola kirilowii]
MDFDSVEDAWEFWIEYGAGTGFTPRKLNTHKRTKDGLPSNAIFNTKENPFFYYDLQLDSEEQITNIFWADARIRIDYGLFGDVISFDTTYLTNKESRPFGVFIGLNHHRSTVIFGAAILYDETIASFEWLFESFLNCHSQRHPRTIFTDQDAAMMKALHNVMHDTYHGLCTFHIMQNGIRHLGNLMKDGSSFLSHFQKSAYNVFTIKRE